MFAEIRKKYFKEPLLFPFIVTTAGSTVAERKQERPKGFPEHHLLIVTGGSGYFEVAGKRFLLSAGQGFFMRKDVPHSYDPQGRLSTLWVTFLGGESVLDYYGIGQSFIFEASNVLMRSTQSLIDFCSGNSTLLTRSAAGYSWLNDWLHDHFSASAPVEVQVRRYLEAHFAEELSLEQIASAVHMSRYSLCHYYQEHCRETVIDQLKRIRIEKACRMLRFSDESIEQISASCGIESPSYFSKLFKEQIGCTPREYRKKK